MSQKKLIDFGGIVSALDELTESQLRQLHAIIGIRIGADSALIPAGGKSSGASTRGKTSARGRGGQGSRRGQKRGNPQRKSQWATNPLYLEYVRLKKSVETQAKEQKCSFSLVNSDEKRAYDAAFAAWMTAKSSFRSSREGAETASSSEEESTREGTQGGPSGETGGSGSTPQQPGTPEASSSVIGGRSSWADDVESTVQITDSSKRGISEITATSQGESAVASGRAKRAGGSSSRRSSKGKSPAH